MCVRFFFIDIGCCYCHRVLYSITMAVLFGISLYMEKCIIFVLFIFFFQFAISNESFFLTQIAKSHARSKAKLVEIIWCLVVFYYFHSGLVCSGTFDAMRWVLFNRLPGIEQNNKHANMYFVGLIYFFVSDFFFLFSLSILFCCSHIFFLPAHSIHLWDFPFLACIFQCFLYVIVGVYVCVCSFHIFCPLSCWLKTLVEKFFVR